MVIEARQSLEPGQLYAEEPVILERPSDDFIDELPEVGTSQEVIDEIVVPEESRSWSPHALIEILTGKFTSR